MCDLTLETAFEFGTSLVPLRQTCSVCPLSRGMRGGGGLPGPRVPFAAPRTPFPRLSPDGMADSSTTGSNPRACLAVTREPLRFRQVGAVDVAERPRCRRLLLVLRFCALLEAHRALHLALPWNVGRTASVSTFLLRGPVPCCQIAVRPCALQKTTPCPCLSHPAHDRTPRRFRGGRASNVPPKKHRTDLAWQAFIAHSGRWQSAPSAVRGGSFSSVSKNCDVDWPGRLATQRDRSLRGSTCPRTHPRWQ